MSPYHPPPQDSYSRASFTPYANSRRQQRTVPPQPIAPIINPFGPPASQPAELNAAAQAPRHAVDTLGDRKVAAFINGIPENVADECVEKILSACGEISSWRRVRDANDRPQTFGFCEFSNMKSAVCAMRVLSNQGGLKQAGWSLPGLAPAESKTLVIKFDYSVQKHIQSLAPLSAADSQAEKDAETSALESVGKIISQLAGSTGSHECEDADGSDNANTDSSIEKKALSDKHDAKAIYGKTVTSIRNDSKADDETTKGDSSSSLEDNLAEEASFSLENEDKWEREQAELSRHRHYISGIAEREYRLSKAEEERETRIERNAIRELDRVEERQRERDSASVRLAQWDDEKEEKLRDHEYYRDRERWWHHRKAARSRELELDSIDRSQQQQQDEKHREALGVAGHQHAVNGDTQQVAERRSLIEKLIGEIPAEPERLFEWGVKWQYVDEDTISNKIEPATRKRLIEYLGGESDDGSLEELTEFVIGYIRDHKPPQGLVEELEMILVEEAPVFVARIWRVVVYESEARARHID
ncbi:hypothetical protein GGI12_002318 [Dipsacomyces acuminosporus]|nr:hypothetical protein GGI12_002318 [Dipsacomyces acuminosporus]